MPAQAYVQPVAGIAAGLPGSMPNGFIQQGASGMEGCFFAIQQSPFNG